MQSALNDVKQELLASTPAPAARGGARAIGPAAEPGTALEIKLENDGGWPADYQPVGDYLTEAPNDGKQYVRKAEAWAEAVTYDDSTLLATIAALEARIDTLENASGSSLWTDNGDGTISYSGTAKATDFVAG